MQLDSDDFYSELRLRGYKYENEFCAVQSAHSNGSGGKVKWLKNNWITCQIQFCMCKF